MKRLCMFLLAAVIIFGGFSTITARANSAYYEPADGGSGIVFKESENISIQREVLDITVMSNEYQDSVLKFKATYYMKNKSNSAVSAKSMFIIPANYGEINDIEVKKNNEDIQYIQEYFSEKYRDFNNKNNKLENWEEIIAASKTRTLAFGEPTGFKLYTFENKRVRESSTSAYEVEFEPESYFFCEPSGFTKESSGKIKLRFYNKHFTFVSRGEPNPILLPDYIQYTVEEIPDIYDYLLTKGSKDIPYQMTGFAESQFNQYLLSLEKNYEVYGKELITEFHAYKINSYLSTVSYDLDFEANEAAEVSVIYSVPVYYANRLGINYLLSPAKYWEDFGGITINLTVKQPYGEMTYSSLPFEKTGDYTYKYQSDKLPTNELSISFDTRYRNGCANVGFDDFLSGMIVVILIFFISLIIFIIAFAVNCVKARKKH